MRLLEKCKTLFVTCIIFHWSVMTYDLKPYAILKDLLLFYVCICVFFVNLCVALTWRRPQKPKGIRFQGTGVQVAVSCSMGAEM